MLYRRRILVVDGSKYFDSSMWRTLIPESEFEIAGLARNNDEAVEMAAILSPNIILVDLSHSEMRGVRAIRTLSAAQPAIPIIALAPIASQEYTQAALDAGASACFAKSDIVGVLLQTIWNLIPAQAPESGHYLSQGVGL